MCVYPLWPSPDAEAVFGGALPHMVILSSEHMPDNRVMGNIPDFFLLAVPLFARRD